MSTLDIQIPNGPTGAGSTADQELFFARRALALIKERLGNDGMANLLVQDSDAADAWWEQKIRESKGEFRYASVTIQAKGLVTKDLLGWYMAHHDQPALMWAAHPEHYVYGVGPILETIGLHPTYIVLEITKEPHACVTNRDPAKYPIALTATGKLRSGTAMGHACHQFRDFNEDEGVGFEVCFGAWMPAATPDEVVERQRQHLAVEWTNWIEVAYNYKHSTEAAK